MKNIFLIISILSILLITSKEVNNKELSILSKEINNKQEAIEIAKSYVFNEYQQHFEDYEIIVELEDDIWIVAYVKPLMLGGGGPVVNIKKINGEVIGCALQK